MASFLRGSVDVAARRAGAHRLVHVHRLSGGPGDGLLAVRPDGHVGFRGSAGDVKGLCDWLRWAGITDFREISFRPNLATTDAETGRQQAHADARELAKTF